MFDIAFTELMVIGLVALIVIGPEKLPRMARTVGHLAGRLQRYVSDVKADISREMELDELRKLQATMRDAAQSFERSVSKEISETESELQKITEADSSSSRHDEQPREQAPPPAASNQLELGIDAPPPTPERKQV